MITDVQLQTITESMMWVDNDLLIVRPIEITDTGRLERMFGRLSRESIQYRFFSPIREIPRAQLLRLATVDHWRRDALVVLDGDEIVAVARYDGLTGDRPNGAREAEIAVTVEDAWQRRGIGRRLARRLGVLAAERDFDAFIARILPDNRAALNLVRELVPDAVVKFAVGDYEARLPL